MLKITRTVRTLSVLALAAPLLAQADNHHEFSMVILPDTQTYTSLRPQIMEAQIGWITANRANENIVYVGHLGDIKDRGNCTNATLAWPSLASPSTEWQIIRRAYDQLDDAGIPYGVAPGNHDFDQQNGDFPADFGGCASNSDNVRPLVGYNQTFPVSTLSDLFVDNYGSFREDSNEDNYTLVSANGIDFLFINLGYHQEANERDNTPEIDWAVARMEQFPNHLAIVISHFLVDCNPSPTNGGSTNNSCASSAANGLGTYGANVFDRLGIYPNLFMLIGGHRFGETYTRLRVDDPTTPADESLGGLNPVHGVLANYQHLQYSGTNFESVPVPGPANGSSGYFKLLRFDVDSMTVDLVSVSPALAAQSQIDGNLGATPPIQNILSNGDRPAGAFPTLNTAAISARDVFIDAAGNTVDVNGAPRALHTQSVSNLRDISFADYVTSGGGGNLDWTITGPGTIAATVNADGSQSLSYSLNPAGLSQFRSWTVTSNPVPAAGDYTVNWNWNGLHAWFRVIARLTASDGTVLVNAGPANCCTTPSNGFNYSGSHTFTNVAAGQTIGFTMGGQNFDRNNFLRGTLTLSQ